jgi:hypothetical protein
LPPVFHANFSADFPGLHADIPVGGDFSDFLLAVAAKLAVTAPPFGRRANSAKFGLTSDFNPLK